MTTEQLQRREEIRHETLAHLVDRFGTSQSADTIRRNLAREIRDLRDAEVIDALAYLAGLPQPLVDSDVDELGSTRYFYATTAGVQFVERRG